jgi:hypothetical protein
MMRNYDFLIVKLRVAKKAKALPDISRRAFVL